MHGYEYPSAWARDRSTGPTSAESAISTWAVDAAPSNMHVCEGANQCRLRFFGAGSAADTNTVMVYLVGTDDKLNPTTWYIMRHSSIACVTGTATGPGTTSQVLSTELFADGITITDVGSVGIDGALAGDTTAYTSVANDIGEVVMAGLGGAEYIMFRYTLVNSTNFNTLFKLY